MIGIDDIGKQVTHRDGITGRLIAIERALPDLHFTGKVFLGDGCVSFPIEELTVENFLGKRVRLEGVVERVWGDMLDIGVAGRAYAVLASDVEVLE